MLHVSPDGHGYIVYGNRDSVYVPMQRIRRMDLSDGDRLVVDVVAPRRYGAHPVMNELRMRNGEEFDYSTLYNRPSRTSGADVAVDLLPGRIVHHALDPDLRTPQLQGGAFCPPLHGVPRGGRGAYISPLSANGIRGRSS